MTTSTTLTQNQTSRKGDSAARVVMASAWLFIGLVMLLHLIKPEFDPSWRMVSEYEIGRFGWLMSTAFLALAVSCIAAFITTRSHVTSRAGHVGRIFLVLTAVGLTLGGIFTTDPITATRDQLTSTGNLHGLGTMIGIPSFIVAATLVGRALRQNPGWSRSRRPLLVATALVWATLILFVGSIAVTFNGSFGPDVQVGWPNRLLVAALALWLIIVGNHSNRNSVRR